MKPVTSRALGFTETVFAALHEASGSHVIRVVVALAGVVKPEIIESAMNVMVARHPMLRTRLVLERGRYRFDLMHEVKPSFGILFTHDGHTLDTVIAEQDTLTFGPGDPLYHVVFVLDRDRGRMSVVWFLHHAIGDGLSADMITAELCDCLDMIAGERMPQADSPMDLPASLETKIASGGSSLRLAGILAKEAIARRGVSTLQHGRTCTVSERRPHGMFVVFSPAQTARIKARANKSQVGMSDLLGASMLKATAESQFPEAERVRLPFFMPIDYRRHMEGSMRTNRKVLSLATHMACFYPDVSRNDSLDDVARALRTQAGKDDVANPRKTLVERFPAWFVRGTLHQRSRQSVGFRHGLVFTHAGRHRTVDTPFVRPEVRFGNMTVRDGCLMMSGISFINANCLILALSYTEPLVSAQTAELISNHIATALASGETAQITSSFEEVIDTIRSQI